MDVVKKTKNKSTMLIIAELFSLTEGKSQCISPSTNQDTFYRSEDMSELVLCLVQEINHGKCPLSLSLVGEKVQWKNYLNKKSFLMLLKVQTKREEHINWELQRLDGKGSDKQVTV
jgi:hypothetical protein